MAAMFTSYVSVRPCALSHDETAAWLDTGAQGTVRDIARARKILQHCITYCDRKRIEVRATEKSYFSVIKAIEGYRAWIPWSRIFGEIQLNVEYHYYLA